MAGGHKSIVLFALLMRETASYTQFHHVNLSHLGLTSKISTSYRSRLHFWLLHCCFQFLPKRPLLSLRSNRNQNQTQGTRHHHSISAVTTPSKTHFFFLDQVQISLQRVVVATAAQNGRRSCASHQTRRRVVESRRTIVDAAERIAQTARRNQYGRTHSHRRHSPQHAHRLDCQPTEDYEQGCRSSQESQRAGRTLEEGSERREGREQRSEEHDGQWDRNANRQE